MLHLSSFKKVGPVYFFSFLPQVVADDGPGLGAPEYAAGDDGWLHQYLLAGGQVLLWLSDRLRR
jgi:hypothetical protein